MPLYEYQCEKCGHRFEVIQRFSDLPIAICPSCGQGPVEKLPSSPAIQFKGTGWYITDYARKGQSGTSASTGTTGGKSESGAGSGSESAGDKPAADSSTAKTESKPAESSSKKD
jgi:putative FmdB family regulatory protein